MKKTNKLSLMRLSYIILIAISFVLGSGLMAYLSNILLDQFLCVAAINACFILVYVLSLIHKRLNDKLPEKIYISYGKIAIEIIVFWMLSILFLLFAPDFFAPIIIIPLLGSIVLEDSTNIALSIYFVTILCICQNFNNYVLTCYILLLAFGIILSDFLKVDNPLEKLYCYLILFAINILLPVIFYYFNYLEINSKTFIYALIDSSIVCVTCATLIPFFSKRVITSQLDIYDTILDEDYSLYEDIRKFSFIEFTHAYRVAKLSQKCAEEIGVNIKLATAGGFYYRLGKIVGEPMIDNAIKLANDHCFPDELIQILSEYGCIISLPSSPESAIVHMVDSVVTKVELFDADSMTSTWNQNMVIYQTINELSQKGYYDNSGLSMNQFLAIRERLAKEDILA